LLLGDVGHEAASGRIRPAREPQPGNDCAEKIPRAVALGAMARSVDEIAAAVEGRGSLRIRPERLAVEEQQLPDSEPAATTERERQLVRRRPAGDRGQGL